MRIGQLRVARSRKLLVDHTDMAVAQGFDQGLHNR